MQWFSVVNLNKNKPTQGIFFFFVHQKRKEEENVKMHSEAQHVSSAG